MVAERTLLLWLPLLNTFYFAFWFLALARESLTGGKQVDATAILDYFAPLTAGLDELNKKNGYKTGW